MNDMSTEPEQMNIVTLVGDLGQRAKAAARDLAMATADQRNLALKEAAAALRARTSEILAANAKDLDSIKDSGKDAAFVDRLALSEDRVAAMADAVDAIAGQDDPLGRSLATFNRPNGLKIDRISVPIGVIAMIYESRPNVGSDAGALCVKSGNAVILRGGSESLHSSRVTKALTSKRLSVLCRMPRCAGRAFAGPLNVW